jgi:hypothetical protein
MMDRQKVRPTKKKLKILPLILSALITGFLLYYVFSRPSGLSWKNLLTRFNPLYAWAYLGFYGIGLLLRTWRYSLLVGTSAGPKVHFGGLILVTAVRNMMVDLLPARIGGLSYPVLLNRVVGVDLSHCLSSFTYAFVFDLICLGPLLSLALLWDSLTTSRSNAWLWIISGLILILSLLGLMLLQPLLRGLTSWVKTWTGRAFLQKIFWIKGLPDQLDRLDHSFDLLRRSRLFWPLLALSLAIRAVKYLLLYLMLTAVVAALLDKPINLPFLIILLGLMGSEISASLPISGLAGIGFYEGVLGGTLAGLGLQPAQGVSLALAMHLLTQVVDYSLGSGALIMLLYFWVFRGKRGATV